MYKSKALALGSSVIIAVILIAPALAEIDVDDPEDPTRDAFWAKAMIGATRSNPGFYDHYRGYWHEPKTMPWPWVYHHVSVHPSSITTNIEKVWIPTEGYMWFSESYYTVTFKLWATWFGIAYTDTVIDTIAFTPRICYWLGY